MAKIFGANTKISGKVGQLLYRQTKVGTVVSEALSNPSHLAAFSVHRYHGALGEGTAAADDGSVEGQAAFATDDASVAG